MVQAGAAASQARVTPYRRSAVDRAPQRRQGLIRASTLKGRFRACQGLPGSAAEDRCPDTHPDPNGAVVDLALELHRELGLKPWHPSIFAVGSIGEADEERNPPDDPYRLKNWLMVRDIRRRLVEVT
jgi:hypothetical protein